MDTVANGEYFGFDHVTFWVGNALQAAGWYIARFGFENVAYRGLETGDRKYVTHVIKQDKIFMSFVSPLTCDDEVFADHMKRHGDGVRDVAFTVSDVNAIYEQAVASGAKSIRAPETISDEHGSVVIATIASPYGETSHTFVDRSKYTGAFLPGYTDKVIDDPLSKIAATPGLLHIDHIVSNQPDLQMTPVVEWYENVLKFHRFWSVDDKTIHTEYSSLRSIVVTDKDEAIKMPINEPANGKKKSQIQEYVDFYAGAGVQHIALRTNDIISSVAAMKARGVQFLSVPKSYYTSLREKLAHAPITVKEDLDRLEQLHILIDYDDKGYLLQIFTKNVEDKPTVFFEVIQRNNHQGFGAGNFKSLFEAIEREQEKRATTILNILIFYNLFGLTSALIQLESTCYMVRVDSGTPPQPNPDSSFNFSSSTPDTKQSSTSPTPTPHANANSNWGATGLNGLIPQNIKDPLTNPQNNLGQSNPLTNALEKATAIVPSTTTSSGGSLTRALDQIDKNLKEEVPSKLPSPSAILQNPPAAITASGITNVIPQSATKNLPKLAQIPLNLNCSGAICPNGKCVTTATQCIKQLTGIIPRCSPEFPVRCLDGSCKTTLALCPKLTDELHLCNDEVCPDGKCGPCFDYDGCSLDQPFQCPNGVCVESVSECYQCKDGHLRCFDGSCVSPCPYPPFYFKPISIVTLLTERDVQTLIPVSTYSSPLNYTTEIKKLLDIYIEPTSFPENTTFSVSPVSDSYVNTINGEYNWPVNTSYQLFLLSPVINITATYKGIPQTNFEPKVKLVFELMTPPDFNISDICLGYIDVITNRWTCIPDSVESINGSTVTTYTDHFTSFALLTRVQYDESEGGAPVFGESGPIISHHTLMFSLIFGAIGLAVITIVVGVLLHYRSKHGGVRKWMVFSRTKSSSNNVTNNNKKY
ncbi:4-hydroxyphenylpyruvate dioxygenase [Heterostelium album PN500]|uniref:4-hydroxyphenylpyruvate dioxygenase n=1 Tax=Heterostelium pallidum (strain ATCC 26659 / Pp 5 / PN500) TaxID=670386 RepID=D3BP99_HETP5|nr:4-hydroxyphenylpyruvate dioxygenase [Heterostelium album PN500]EFA77109.1 4-hydroxyphenylpyruvate dioxygenase [Heterostelium album PN500]|eukprot:XP_020429238.1 4-hydroxyphenylpyruvate dioxygenase [Heterostelium album PN500]